MADVDARRGLSADMVVDIAGKKSEPEWILDSRLEAPSPFDRKPVPISLLRARIVISRQSDHWCAASRAVANSRVGPRAVELFNGGQ